MLPSRDAEDLGFGTDEEFQRRLNEFGTYCLEQIRKYIWSIIYSDCSCSSCCVSVAKSIKKKCSKQPIASIVFVLVIILFIPAMVFLRGQERGIVAIYSMLSLFSSIISLSVERGVIVYTEKIANVAKLEQSRLLEGFYRRRRLEADQPAEKGTKVKKLHFKKALLTVMENKGVKEAAQTAKRKVLADVHRGNSYTPIEFDNSAGPSSAPDPFSPLDYDFDHSTASSNTFNSFTPLDYDFDNSAGPLSAPDPFPPLDYDDNSSGQCIPPDALYPPTLSRTRKRYSTASGPSVSSPFCTTTVGVSSENADDMFIVHSFGDDGNDKYNEPPQRLREAYLAVDAVKAFGLPVHVLGADSYKIVQYIEDECVTDDSSLLFGSSGECKTDAEAKRFEVSAKVHPYSGHPKSCSSDGSISVQSILEASKEDSHKTVQYTKDECVSDVSSVLVGSSDEYKTDAEAKYFEVSAKVHPNSPVNSSSDGSISVQSVLEASKEDSHKIVQYTEDERVSDVSSLLFGSSDEYKTDAEAKYFEVSSKVHPNSPVNSSSDGSIFFHPTSEASKGSADLDSDIFYMDDQSFESAISVQSDDGPTQTDV